MMNLVSILAALARLIDALVGGVRMKPARPPRRKRPTASKRLPNRATPANSAQKIDIVALGLVTIAAIAITAILAALLAATGPTDDHRQRIRTPLDPANTTGHARRSREPAIAERGGGPLPPVPRG